jgi:hypothetical protein
MPVDSRFGVLEDVWWTQGMLAGIVDAGLKLDEEHATGLQWLGAGVQVDG